MNVCGDGRFAILFFFFQNFDCCYINILISEDWRVRGNIKMGMKRSASSVHKCCYPDCHRNTDLRRKPKRLQYEVLKKFKFFITDDTRLCPEHLDIESWENVDDVAKISNFNEQQIERITEILRKPKPSWDQSLCGNHYFHFILCF